MLQLVNDTLGEKHRHFNKLVRDACADKQFNLTKINNDESDIDNLLKIDTAAKTKNVEFIIDVLKCDDMLYISRAIKKSPWLITEQEYAHIIDPQYLYTELFPHMLTKAINKLLLHIRLRLKDEKRVEAFYNYFIEQDKSKEAHKWLLNSSTPFIENVIKKECYISSQLYKRLCKRSVKFLQYCTMVERGDDKDALKAVSFLIKSDTESYLNALLINRYYNVPSFGKRHTNIVMKKCPKHILDNFEKYMGSIDLSVVAKHMDENEICLFILKNLANDSTRDFFCNFANVKHFVWNLPAEHRFEFVKTIYIDIKEPGPCHIVLNNADESERLALSLMNSYHWYQYAPFAVAFSKLTTLIGAESELTEKYTMLSVMIKCAKNNPIHTKSTLNYYYEKHSNEPKEFKVRFVNSVIMEMPTYKFDRETWNILNKLFQSLNVYSESEYNVQMCLESIVLYKILNDENIPDVVEKKINFDTFKKIQNNLNNEEQNKVFTYLVTSLSTKLQNKIIQTESDFKDAIEMLKNSLDLLLDWDKNINEYTFIQDNIRKLIKIKKENLWKLELSSLYNTNKSWRRYMFEESLSMCLNEEVCLNALKHDPKLLTRHNDDVDALRIDDTTALRRLLTKLRIYWPQSFAKEWINAYLNNLNLTRCTTLRASIKGLFILFPRGQVTDIAKKHVPKDEKIKWNEINQTEFILRKNIAKYLYIARPQPSVDTVLWYARGDYLQYAKPSLSSILHNISNIQRRAVLLQLLERSVSLQKYGLHLACTSLKYEELKPLFFDIWKTTKDTTIRANIFTYTYNLLCKVKDPTLAQELWELLSIFIDKLTANKNKIILNKLGNPKNIHICIQGKFFMKTYDFFASLPPEARCVPHQTELIKYAPDIMNVLNADFVVTKLLAKIEDKISNSGGLYIPVISAYVLHGVTEEEQYIRFEEILIPVLQHIFALWNVITETHKREYVMKFNFDLLVKTLTWDFRKLIVSKKIIMPVNLFSAIKTFIERTISIEDNYVRYVNWKLTTEYVALVAEYKDMLCDPKLDNIPPSHSRKNRLPQDAESVWETIHIAMSPKLAKVIVQLLKNDCINYLPGIYFLFSDALTQMFLNLFFQKTLMILETLKYMALCDAFVPNLLVVCDQISDIDYGHEDKEKLIEIRNIISANTSEEVQLHLKAAFGNKPELIP